MPKPTTKGGEKQIKKSTSKKKALKPSKKAGDTKENPTEGKSPSLKNRPSSVKKDVRNVSKEKVGSAPRGATASGKKKQRFTSLGRKKSTKKELKEEDKSDDNTKRLQQKEGGDKNSKKKSGLKSTSKDKKRERSRNKSTKKEKEDTPQKSTPTKSNKSTPSKQQSSPGSSSRSIRYKELSSGKVPKTISFHGSKKAKSSPYPSKSVSSSRQGTKKISAQKVKESSSNIESSSSIDLSGEQKKGSSSARRSSEVHEVHGPDSQRISKEVEEVIKRIEDKKKHKGTKLLDKKRKRGDSQALIEAHTAKDFDYILQKNPNVKSKPYINLEDLSKHHLITYSDILLALLEVGQNAESYLFPYSSKSRCFWSDILEYRALKKIFVDFKAETLRKYWSELSKYDTEDASDLIKKNKSFLDKTPLKLGTIVSSISKLLSGKIKNLKEYIENIQVDIRKREFFEHEFENPVTGEITKVKEVRTTYNTRKRYEPGNVKDFKGSTVNIVSLKEVYHQNSNLTDFQKVMKNIKKEDSVKFTYLNEKTEEEKRKVNAINEEDKFVFKAIDNVVDALSSEFKNKYSTDFILDTLQQNSMDIGRTHACLNDPSKRKIIGFTPLDDKVLLKKQGEEYKILVKEKGKDAIQEREEFLNH